MSHRMKPLGFDPARIKGMSEKLIVSHYENNYGGAVKRLGQIEDQLASLDVASAPGFLINGLKREQLIASNSMVLHELFFDGLGDESQPGGELMGPHEEESCPTRSSRLPQTRLSTPIFLITTLLPFGRGLASSNRSWHQGAQGASRDCPVRLRLKDRVHTPPPRERTHAADHRNHHIPTVTPRRPA